MEIYKLPKTYISSVVKRPSKTSKTPYVTDIILENESQIQEFLPDILGQALARTWIDRRFLEAFYEHPIEILEKAGVFLPKSISIEFSKEEKERPKVVVFKNSGKNKIRLLQLKLVMVAGT